MSRATQTFLTGFKDAIPILLGVVPYAMIVGVVGVGIGMRAFDVTGMSAIVFAGASQLAAMELIERSAPAVVIVITTIMINLRFTMYSAALASQFARVPWPARAIFAFSLSDQAFALYSIRLRDDPDTPRAAYALGVSVPFYFVWVGCTAVGAVLGAQVPPEWQLEFTLPLTFLALMFPSIRDRPSLAAAVVGGTLALALRDLPMNLGLVLAALAGVGAGAAAERRTRGACGSQAAEAASGGSAEGVASRSGADGPGKGDRAAREGVATGEREPEKAERP